MLALTTQRSLTSCAGKNNGLLSSHQASICFLLWFIHLVLSLLTIIEGVDTFTIVMLDRRLPTRPPFKARNRLRERPTYQTWAACAGGEGGNHWINGTGPALTLPLIFCCHMVCLLQFTEAALLNCFKTSSFLPRSPPTGSQNYNTHYTKSHYPPGNHHASHL